jgi:hypothetical protein
VNKWKIPDWLEQEVRKRDVQCIYCNVSFGKKNISRKLMPTWEHIINDARIVTIDNIALCCCSCNASKGAKKLMFWLDSSYCMRKNITAKTVADVVKRALHHV